MRFSRRSLAILLAAGALCVVPRPGQAQPTATVDIPMSDGVTLTTDLYAPTDGSPQPWPVILVRTPYGRAGSASTAVLFNALGIGVVAQDVRGYPPSGGTPCVFTCDGTGALQDGADTLDWIQAQSWSNGLVATLGGSALGITQYVLATTSHPALVALWAQVATPSFYDHAMFPGGVFKHAQVTGWLSAHAPSFLNEIVAHPLADSFWDTVQTADQFGDVQVPAVHMGGWYDIFSQGTIDAFVGYQHSGGPGALGTQKLILGPWVHGGPATQAGELTYPSNAADIPTGLAPLQQLWFQHHLGVVPDQAAVDAVPAVHYYVMGDVDNSAAPGNQWRTAADWPIPAAPMRYYLHADGSLSVDCPLAGDPPSAYTYDPADPSPTVGGNNLILPSGPYDQALAVESRGDVLLFETDVLTAPLEITGRVRAHLWVSIDAVDSDVMVRLTDVYPDGRSMLVLDAASRLASRGVNHSLTPLTPGEIVEAVVDLWSTSIILDQGHRLRISVTSSNWERFRASPNDGSSYGEPENPRPVQVTLYHDADHLSYLELPDPNRDPSAVNLCAPVITPDAGVEADGQVDPDGAVILPDGTTGADAAVDPGASGSGCSCRSVPPTGFPGLLLLLGVLLLWVRRRAR